MAFNLAVSSILVAKSEIIPATSSTITTTTATAAAAITKPVAHTVDERSLLIVQRSKSPVESSKTVLQGEETSCGEGSGRFHRSKLSCSQVAYTLGLTRPRQLQHTERLARIGNIRTLIDLSPEPEISTWYFRHTLHTHTPSHPLTRRRVYRYLVRLYLILKQEYSTRTCRANRQQLGDILECTTEL
ncbi:hypothetical protein ElyMa_004757400 [Elysia marginata]|uniref:Uncharacterized protein n=1 Tax=Elysia marginata TaxID=1093978 RepID=A0AAV4IFG9_9GAST|nr:hypothetical protein ElyMa_004757400 [Elysia marginata]